MDLEKARASDEKLLTWIGRLTVTWAHLEFALDAMILIIHKRMDGSKFEDELPRALKNKISYLRAAFKRLGIPAEDLPRYMAFLDSVRTESVTRHDIIHGFPVHHPSDEGEAKLIRLLVQKHDWEQREVTISIASVAEAASRAMGLAEKARDWAVAMLDAYQKHLSQQHQSDAQ